MKQQNLNLTDLIALLQMIDVSSMSDCYLHRNYETGEAELNIELHNISDEDYMRLRNRIFEDNHCAYWE